MLLVAAYQQVTREWWRSAPDRFVVFASALVISEAGTGDEDAARARLDLLATIPALLDATPEAVELTRTLLDLGAVPRKAADDAAHIAIAATNGVDYLVTWNFRHIANATMRSRIEDVCQQSGHKPPVICHPQRTHGVRPCRRIQRDPIIDELRAVRDAHAARCGYDVEKIFRDIRATQQASGREYVRLPARRVRSDAEDRATP